VTVSFSNNVLHHGVSKVDVNLGLYCGKYGVCNGLVSLFLSEILFPFRALPSQEKGGPSFCSVASPPGTSDIMQHFDAYLS
jgi:hypothetical protein